MLHLAPERGLSRALLERVGPAGYMPVDVQPDRLAAALGIPVGRFDLCRDSFALARGSYDLILHNHVLEHVPCNYTLVLQALTRALRPGGHQVFTVPMTTGYYREDMTPTLSGERRLQAFKRHDHMRIFGKADFEETLGRLLGVTADYAIVDLVPEAALRDANVPVYYWRGISGSSAFILRPDSTPDPIPPPDPAQRKISRC